MKREVMLTDTMKTMVMSRANWRCEWCGAAIGEPHPNTAKPVTLTVIHLNRDRLDASPSNLRAVCQECLSLRGTP